MEIVRPNLPFLVELRDDDITIMHLAFYEYSDILKKNKQINSDKKRKHLQKINRMIALVDSMM